MRLLTTVSGSPIQTVTGWLRSLTSSLLPASYEYVPLDPTPAPAVAVAHDPEAADPQAPLDAPAVVPRTIAPTGDSLGRFSAEATRLVAAQGIARENLETNGYRSDFKIARYRGSMIRLVNRVARSLDPRYPSLGEHSTFLEDDLVEQAAFDGVMDALETILQTEDYNSY